MASLSQGRTAAAQCGLFTYKSVPVIIEPPCININNHMTLKTKSEQRTLLWRNLVRKPKPHISAPLDCRRSNSLGRKNGSVLQTTFHDIYNVSKSPWSVNWLFSMVVHFALTDAFLLVNLLISLLVIQLCLCTLRYLRLLLSDIIWPNLMWFWPCIFVNMWK